MVVAAGMLNAAIKSIISSSSDSAENVREIGVAFAAIV